MDRVAKLRRVAALKKAITHLEATTGKHRDVLIESHKAHIARLEGGL